jgi:hypothetical protein
MLSWLRGFGSWVRLYQVGRQMTGFRTKDLTKNLTPDLTIAGYGSDRVHLLLDRRRLGREVESVFGRRPVTMPTILWNPQVAHFRSEPA